MLNGSRIRLVIGRDSILNCKEADSESLKDNPSASIVRSSHDWEICMALCISFSCAASRPATSIHSSCLNWLTRGVNLGTVPEF